MIPSFFLGAASAVFRMRQDKELRLGGEGGMMRGDREGICGCRGSGSGSGSDERDSVGGRGRGA